MDIITALITLMIVVTIIMMADPETKVHLCPDCVERS